MKTVFFFFFAKRRQDFLSAGTTPGARARARPLGGRDAATGGAGMEEKLRGAAFKSPSVVFVMGAGCHHWRQSGPRQHDIPKAQPRPPKTFYLRKWGKKKKKKKK